jgi:hypothetical protein
MKIVFYLQRKRMKSNSRESFLNDLQIQNVLAFGELKFICIIFVI